MLRDTPPERGDIPTTEWFAHSSSALKAKRSESEVDEFAVLMNAKQTEHQQHSRRVKQ